MSFEVLFDSGTLRDDSIWINRNEDGINNFRPVL